MSKGNQGKNPASSRDPRGPGVVLGRRAFLRAGTAAGVALLGGCRTPASPRATLRPSAEGVAFGRRLFRPLKLDEYASEFSVTGLESYRPWVAPRGLWPTRHGCAGRTGSSGEPLPAGRWRASWHALHGLRLTVRPHTVLVGEDAVYLEGDDWRATWDHDGRLIGKTKRGAHETLIDVAGRRLLANRPEGGGLYTHLLPGGERDAAVRLSHPAHATTRLLAGPDYLLLLVSVSDPHVRPESVVEVARILDWSWTRRRLFGKYRWPNPLKPLAGIRRNHVDVEAAAGPTGPVLATSDGVVWCDWHLRPLRGHPVRGRVLALSVDQAGRAYLMYDRFYGKARLAIISPTRGQICDHALPWKNDLAGEPALLSEDGCAYLTPIGHVMALDPRGKILWHRKRTSPAPGSTAAGRLLVVTDGELCAVSSDGTRTALWRPPEPVVTAPVLARGRIHLATANRLHVLEPD